MNDRVSSVRELGWTPDGGGGWNTGSNSSSGSNWGGGGNWGSGARTVLYSGYNLSGEPFVVEASGIRNLDRAGFNDKARSLRVESGYWVFCSDANYEGDCHTYGPGDYGTLPAGQNQRISSGRRISNDYPYRNNANWGNSSGSGGGSSDVSKLADGSYVVRVGGGDCRVYYSTRGDRTTVTPK